MKKNLQVEPDIAGIIVKIQEQLVSLEKKVDILLSQPAPRPVEARPSFQRPSYTHQGPGRQDSNYRERVLHKATCADCKKECEVPFRPREDRPVYCKECFSKRKTDSPFKPNNDNRREDTRPAQESYFSKPKRGKGRKSSDDKKWFPKKRKKRS
jgi:CxxC-x17-CxxC domain-containing protein